ncbi:putative phosphoprotein [Atrato Rhabdo-like virus 3]|uniref:Putative phosphoprotein n=1 Tax=Atrato Rhabdo-like virus 3 TaxID=2689335 RepID=A0A6B9KTW1_9RHAB|nr:putative phosphoprotein [Atrato Rhabdo-like virus 3]
MSRVPSFLERHLADHLNCPILTMPRGKKKSSEGSQRKTSPPQDRRESAESVIARVARMDLLPPEPSLANIEAIPAIETEHEVLYTGPALNSGDYLPAESRSTGTDGNSDRGLDWAEEMEIQDALLRQQNPDQCLPGEPGFQGSVMEDILYARRTAAEIDRGFDPTTHLGWIYHALAGLIDFNNPADFLKLLSDRLGSGAIKREPHENRAVQGFSANIATVLSVHPRAAVTICQRLPCTFSQLETFVSGMVIGVHYSSMRDTKDVADRMSDMTDKLQGLFTKLSQEQEARNRETSAQTIQFNEAAKAVATSVHLIESVVTTLTDKSLGAPLESTSVASTSQSARSIAIKRKIPPPEVVAVITDDGMYSCRMATILVAQGRAAGIQIGDAKLQMLSQLVGLKPAPLTYFMKCDPIRLAKFLSQEPDFIPQFLKMKGPERLAALKTKIAPYHTVCAADFVWTKMPK